jgi:hypothetical protein
MSDIWEDAVETYLAMDRGLLLNPQYLIKDDNNWEACPDFLAIEFHKDTAWMVEVTKSPRKVLFEKISDFKKDYVPRILSQLKTHKIIRDSDNLSDWKIGFWIFVPGKDVETVKNEMEKAAIDPFEVTRLEDTLSPDAWSKRYR